MSSISQNIDISNSHYITHIDNNKILIFPYQRTVHLQQARGRIYRKDIYPKG